MSQKKFTFLSILSCIIIALLLTALGCQSISSEGAPSQNKVITFTSLAAEKLTPTPIPTHVPTIVSTTIPVFYITEEEIAENTVWLEIPKIQVHTLIEKANVVYASTNLSFDQPQDNPKWVPGWSSNIGLPGTALIYGHRQWGPVPKVFTNLDSLETDDKVIVTSTQRLFVYKVVETMIVNPEEVWPIVIEHDEQSKKDGKSQLILLTCTPWGTDWQRLIVFLALEEASNES